MATLNKNFKVKHGLVVEGTTATVNNYDILTKKPDDVDYIVNLIGGTATALNENDTVVKRDGTGSFAATTVTVDSLEIGSMGTINTASGDELAITASEGEDIRLTADDVRVDAVDDFRVNVGGDILLATSGVETNVYVGSIDTGNEIVVESTLDAHIGDATVDGTAGNTVYDRIFNAKAEAIAAAEDYADGLQTTITTDYQAYADQAEADAKAYTDTRETAITTAYQSYADQAEADAISAAALDATAKADQAEADAISAAALDATTKADAAEQNAKDYADSLASNYDAAGAADAALVDAKAYTDAEVAALVDGAPALLDTLNELAAAIADNPNYATDVANLVATKADTTYVDTQDTATLNSAKSYADQAELDAVATAAVDATSKANAAQQAAEDFATAADTALYGTVTGDIATAKSEAGVIAQGYADTAEANAKSYADDLVSDLELAVDNLSTTDVAEGTNLYFTDGRAKDSAAALLTNATLTNITITGTGNDGLVITAENGVADSTTDDLLEGATNKYFTPQRALDATASAYDPAGSSSSAQAAAEDYADGVALTAENNAKAYTDARETAITSAYEAYADQAEVDAKAYADNLVDGLSSTVDNLTTDDVAEGTTNKYFSNSLAFDATAGQLVEGSNVDIAVDNVNDTITVSLADDVVIPSTGSLNVESKDFNVGADSAGLRTADGYVNPIAVFSMDADDDYAQVVIKNTGSGVNSSSDIQLYSNNGDDINGGWVDLGITSATFADPGFTITGANDGYIFMEAPAGTTGNGDFVIATGSNGARNAIVFAAGGLQSDNTQMTIIPDESVVIAIDTPSTSPSTGALVVNGGVGIQGDVNIQGNITFGGEGTSLTTENLAVTDPMVYVGDQNPSDAVDMGIVTEYKDGATTKYAGLVRDASDGVFKVFSDATTKPVSTVDFAEAGLEYGDLKVDNIEAASATLTNVTIGMVDQDEIAHLNGVTSNIQNQLNDKLELAGGTMSGAIAMGSNKITGLADPTDAQDAATKAYVDAQTTSDIAEGINLYFTDERAVDALEAVVPNFTEIDINSVATQVAAKTTGVTGLTTVYAFAKAEYRSAKFLVKLAYGTHTEVSEVLLTLDSSDNIAMTEYAIVGTNGSLSTIGATISGDNVELTVDTANSSTVTVVGTLLA